MKKILGFALTELVVVAAIFGVLAAIALSAIMQGISGGETYASNKMRKYIAQTDPALTDVRIACTGRKTADHNRYIRCTATGLDQEEQHKEVVAECAVGWSSTGNNGCIPVKARGY